MILLNGELTVNIAIEKNQIILRHDPTTPIWKMLTESKSDGREKNVKVRSRFIKWFSPTGFLGI
jgi:hypothetical protein